MPRLMVDSNNLPDVVRKACQEGTLGSLLVGGRLVKWEATSMAPLARLDRVLGQAGEIDAESEAIAFEFSLPPDDFEPEVLACLPPTPWSIPQVCSTAPLFLTSHRTRLQACGRSSFLSRLPS
jgi:DIS3-like exonuclease 2